MANVSYPSQAPKPAAPAPALNQTQQGAYDLMASTLKAWGLGGLLNDLRNLIVKGDTSPDTLSLALSQTDAYKTRFAGNALRAAQGLPELSPAQYIGLEEQYSNVLRSYGLPAGFYDSHDDFTKLIGNDVSATELQTRAQIAHDQYVAAPSYVRDLWSQYFGTKGDALAAILDPAVGTQIIQDRANQVAIGGAAARVGLGVNQSRAQQLQQEGVTLANAQRAYAQIAQTLPTDQMIAHRFGTQINQTQEENELLLNDPNSTLKRQSLYSSEQGLFEAKPGIDQNTLSVSQEH